MVHSVLANPMYTETTAFSCPPGLYQLQRNRFRAASCETPLLLVCRSLRGLGEKLGIERGIEFDLLDFGIAGLFAVLLVLMFVGQGEAVGGTPVGEIGFAFEGARLSHGLIFFAKNVTGLGINVPADPGDGAADVEDGGVDVADLFRGRGCERERWIVGVLGDADELG